MKIVHILYGILLLIMQNVFASDNTSISANQNQIEGSYIVTFKDPVDNEKPIIWPPDPNRVRSENTPFSEEPSTGQSKEELAKVLGINGKIAHIFETINAAHILMSADEAYRLSQDSRVKSVEPDMMFSTAASTASQSSISTFNNPVYQDGILTIPRVDTPEQVGQYSDVIFSFAKEGVWKLNSFKSLGTSFNFALVEKVESVTTDTLPQQVFLKISGWFSPGCGDTLGKSTLKIENNLFSIVLPKTSNSEANQLCGAEVEPFQEIIVLPVFNLPAGTYTYTVNGQFTGNFSLSVDNKLP